MQGVEVGIEEVLMCRERRVDIQNKMIKKYNMPLISFTMNIPGPIKTNQQIKKAFDIGKTLILEKLKENNIEVFEIKELDENTGNELFISVDSTAEKVKDITVAIEESSQLGRLFDIDVIDVNFEKLSRKSFRKCLICEEQAQECGRSRKHSIEVLQNKVEEMLEKELSDKEREYAELEEVWKSEKAALSGSQHIKQALDAAKTEMEQARRAGDLSKMSELQYGRIPELEKQLAAAETGEGKEMSLLRYRVTDEEIAEVLSKATGIPISKMMEGEKEKLLRMEEELHKRVIGQEEAVDAVANAIRRSRAGLSDPNRPIGSFLFLGPTGVGKTELCKTLAKFLFDSEDAMVRIDMSEFMEKHSVSRLVGAPPGYVGYEEGGYLTEAVRRRPYSVILLDEVEKAHADVFNILLQVLDDGRLTDGQGRTVDFRNTVVIMTSNLGSDLIQGSKDESYGEMKALVMSVVSQHFRPEFINRIDETVVFHPLGKDNIRAIASIQLERLAKRMETRGYELVFTEALLDFIGEVGYDPIYGARPLKRAIQQEIENSLAQQVLSGQLLPGKVVTVDYVDGKVQARQ